MTQKARKGFAAVAGALALVFASGAQAAAQNAVLRGLDKVTGHARDFTAPIGEDVRFGTLVITVRACHKRPAEETPEVAIYLEVSDAPPPRAGQEATTTDLFAGWMFASSPALNALEHPVYDVWAIDCRS